MDQRTQVLIGDALSVLRALPDRSVHACITSPPYYGLRSYGDHHSVFGGDPDCPHEWEETTAVRKGSTNGRTDPGGTPAPAGSPGTVGAGAANDAGGTRQHRADRSWTCRRCGAWKGQLGLEPDPDMYVAHLVEIMREVRRVLRDDGTCWLVIGDCYARDPAKGVKYQDGGTTYLRNRQAAEGNRGLDIPAGLKGKDLIGVPWRVAFALQGFSLVHSDVLHVWAADLEQAAREGDWGTVVRVSALIRHAAVLVPLTEDGWHPVWWLRSDIIWAKPSTMPEPVRDRPVRAHEYVFLLVKNPRYYYDHVALMEPAATGECDAMPPIGGTQRAGISRTQVGNRPPGTGLRNRRDVWTVPPDPRDWEFCRACGRLYVGKERNLIRREAARGQDGRETAVLRCLCGATDGWVGHFAVFPGTLVRPMIEAATSPKACPVCGAPWKRIVGKEVAYTRSGVGTVAEGYRIFSGQEGGPTRLHLRPEVTIRTAGWRPTCSCPGNDGSGRAVVLDPFAGSGTTGIEALRLGRDAILIELNPDYAAVIRARVARELARPGGNDAVGTGGPAGMVQARLF